MRWPRDGSTAARPGHDYNMYWPPEQVADFLAFMPAMLAKQSMTGVGLTPGETTNSVRFADWGYAQAIADNPAAPKGLGLNHIARLRRIQPDPLVRRLAQRRERPASREDAGAAFRGDVAELGENER